MCELGDGEDKMIIISIISTQVFLGVSSLRYFCLLIILQFFHSPFPYSLRALHINEFFK